jgi:peptide/nickel transport system permease protein
VRDSDPLLDTDTQTVRPARGSLVESARKVGAWTRANPGISTAWATLLAIILASVFAPWVTSVDPRAVDVSQRLQPPGWGRLFGTDNVGRDVFSRTIYGGRTSLLIGTAVVLLCVGGGTVLGILSGYYRRVDMVVMRFVDGLMSFPALVLAIAMVGVLGASGSTVVLALTVVFTPRVVRIVRSSVLVVKEEPFIESAVSLGASGLYIMGRHLLPNVWSPVIVQASFIFSFAVLGEAALSFLGVGVPADVPSWGNILTDARSYMEQAWWVSIFPGLTIVVTVLVLNVIGDALRDSLDPRLRLR